MSHTLLQKDYAKWKNVNIQLLLQRKKQHEGKKQKVVFNTFTW